jgi:hypothetical protein
VPSFDALPGIADRAASPAGVANPRYDPDMTGSASATGAADVQRCARARCSRGTLHGMKPRVKLRSLALAMSVAVVPGRYDKARLHQPGFLISTACGDVYFAEATLPNWLSKGL